MKTALVTGATGFIGRHLTHRLLADGWTVRAQTRHRSNADALAKAGAQVVEADLRRPESFRPHLRGVDALFHTAALVDIVKPDRRKIHQVNVAGTRAVLLAAKAENVPRIVYLSSVAALGRQGPEMDEDVEHDGDYSTDYEETKHRADMAARELAQEGLPIVLVLPSVVIGPDDAKTGAAFKRLLRGKVPVLPRTDGHVNMVHIDDLIDGIMRAYAKGRVGQRYIFNQATWTTSQVIEAIQEVSGARPPRRIPLSFILPLAAAEEAVATLLRRPPRVSRRAIRLSTRRYGYSSRRAREELGWDPAPFEDRFHETLNALHAEATHHA